MNISNWKFDRKFLLVNILQLIGMAISVSIGLHTLHGEVTSDPKIRTKQLVEIAHGMVSHYVDEANAGRMTQEDAQKAALLEINGLHYAGDNYFWINDMHPRMLAHPAKPEMVGQDLSELKDANGLAMYHAMTDIVRRDKSGFVEYFMNKPGSDKPVAKVSFVEGVEPWGWVIGSGTYLDDAEGIFWRETFTQGMAIAVVVSAAAFVAWWIGHKTVLSLNAVTNGMNRLAAGDTSIDLTDMERKDEIGDILRSVAVFRDNAVAMKKMEDEQANLRVAAEQERRKVLIALAQDLEAGVSGAAEKVNAASALLHQSADSMVGSTDRASEESSVVVTAAERTSSNVEAVAAAAEQLSTSIGEISRQVEQSTGIAGSAVKAVRQTDGVVRGLSEGATRIGEIVDLINSVATQTNLLALNATIEAARAGDAGKGFAVVANEVKHLASQTAQATEDIANQISTIQKTSSEAVEAIRDIGITIEKMNGIATEIASAVQQQGAATRAIAENVNNAAGGAQQVSQHITTVNKTTGEIGSAARGVQSAADQLAQDSTALKSGLDRFLSGIRAM